MTDKRHYPSERAGFSDGSPKAIIIQRLGKAARFQLTERGSNCPDVHLGAVSELGFSPIPEAS